MIYTRLALMSTTTATTAGKKSSSLRSFISVMNQLDSYYYTTRTSSPRVGENNNHLELQQHHQQLQLQKRWNNQFVSCSFFSTNTTTRIIQPNPIELPSNVKIDPKSSFFVPTTSSSTSNLPKQQKKNSKRTNQKKKNKTISKTTTTMKADDTIDHEEEHDHHYDDDHYDDDDDKLLLYPDDIVYAKPLPDRLNVDIHTLLWNDNNNNNNETITTKVGTIYLNESIFGCNPIRIDLLKRSVDYYRAKKRGKRKAHTKTISEVRGSGRKIRQQKGLGRARAGHNRPPHFRGGATAHGPNKHNNTDYGKIKMNKKMYQLALKNGLSQKLKEGNLLLLNDLYNLPSHKTKELVNALSPYNIATGKKDSYSALILDHYYPTTPTTDDDEDQQQQEEEKVQKLSYKGIPINFYIASSNLYQIKVGNVLSSYACNVYDILKYDKVILTLDALQQLESRLTK